MSSFSHTVDPLRSERPSSRLPSFPDYGCVPSPTSRCYFLMKIFWNNERYDAMLRLT